MAKKSNMKIFQRRKMLVIGIIAFFSIIITGEVFGRYFLNLCDSVVYENDSEIGYLLKPNQHCERLGKNVFINQYSMRADSFTAHKSQTNELRLIFLGDSVIYGGSRTDQKSLATSMIKNELGKKLKKPVEVGNISCNGWGPLNEWPYVFRYGLFDADYLAIELRSGSIMQTNLSINGDENFPKHRPYSALWEAWVRFLPKIVTFKGIQSSDEGYHPPVEDLAVLQKNADAINSILIKAQKNGAVPIIILHWIRPEILRSNSEKGWVPNGMLEIEQLAVKRKAAVIDLHDVEAKHVSTIYRDDYHLNDIGQQMVADYFETNMIFNELLSKQ